MHCYEFSQNYRFFDYQAVSAQIQETTRQDFCENLSRFLESRFQAKSSTAEAIATSLFARMTDALLHYHTPVHILSAFQWYEGDLTDLQHLAFWFHDAVYVVDAPKGENEANSAYFMKGMLAPYLKSDDLDQVAEMIVATSQHEEIGNFSDEAQLILDLDICSFAWGPDYQMAVSRAIFEEYVPKYTWEQYCFGRNMFLKKLIAKGFVYRSSCFRERYEAEALETIRKIVASP